MKKLLLCLALIGLLFSCNDENIKDQKVAESSEKIIYHGNEYLADEVQGMVVNESIFFWSDVDNKNRLFDDKSDLLTFAKLNYGDKQYKLLTQHFNNTIEYSEKPNILAEGKAQSSYSDFTLDLYNNYCSGSPYNSPYQIFHINTGAYPSAYIPSVSSIAGYPAFGFGIKVPTGGSMVLQRWSVFYSPFTQYSCQTWLQVYSQTPLVCKDSNWLFCDLFKRWAPTEKIQYSLSL